MGVAPRFLVRRNFEFNLVALSSGFLGVGAFVCGKIDSTV
jgi:hypothetical protein